MTKKYLAIAFVILPTLISCQLMKTSEQNLISPRLPSAAASLVSVTQGPIDDCLNFASLYARNEGLTAECTSNYEHYFSETPAPSISKPNLRIGSFNLLHLGDNQASLKNFKLVAQIMNQWDIVGSQELMPLPGPQAASNHLIAGVIEQTGNNNYYVQKNLQVEKPGYLTLLTELRRLDPSWAVILQSEAEGEGGSGEMAGFYYRQSVVQLRDWGYCPSDKAIDLRTQTPTRNLGCLVQVSEEQKKLISRRAFAAYFQSGNFDFVGLTAHIRFNPAMQATDIQAQTKELCQNFVAPPPSKPTKFVKAGKTVANPCKPTLSDVGRYYEVKAIADQIATIQQQSNDKDVIYMGDFNLELFTTTVPYWNAALKSAEGFKVYQSSPTTLGVKKNALVSNYDHFIFNPLFTTTCSVKGIRPYNFTALTQTPTDLQKMFLAATETAQVQAQMERRLAEVRNFAKAKVNRDNQVFITNLDPKEIEEYRVRMLGAAKRMSFNHVGAMQEQISDHVPIEMECLTN